MLNKIREQRPSYNNNQLISSSVAISSMKLHYYELIAKLYGFVGGFADVVYVNSNWTHAHISHIWNLKTTKHSGKRLMKLYPPCNTTHLVDIPLSLSSNILRERSVLSVGQFRPEKDHILQLRYVYVCICIFSY